MVVLAHPSVYHSMERARELIAVGRLDGVEINHPRLSLIHILKFGTAGLRGVIGAGTNRMNIYVVRHATQGLANWVKNQGGSQTVAISYDSRIKSNLFAKTAAEVLATNGIKVRIYKACLLYTSRCV